MLVLTATTHPALEKGAIIQVEHLIALFYSGCLITQATEPDTAFILGVELVVALDYDEVVASDYLQTVLHFVGCEHGRERVLGLADFYFDADWNVLLHEVLRTGNVS